MDDIRKKIKNKKLLVLGGMRIHCEIIKKAKAMGVFVCVTDYNDISKSPGKRIADQYFDVSTTDVNGVVELIKREKIDGVLMGFADSLLPFYAKICQRAELPCYASKEQFELFSNKRKYKELLKKYDIPVVEEYCIESLEDMDKTDIIYPVIVKPADNSGARGVTICCNPSELQTAYKEALRFSKEQTIIVERFIQGKEATSFWIMQKGSVYLTMLGNRHLGWAGDEKKLRLPIGYTFPSLYTPEYVKEVQPKIAALFHDLGISDGMLFIQNIADGGDLKAYDLGLRLTGSLEYTLLERVCGFNPLEMLICYALTGEMGGEVKKKIDPYMGKKYPWNISFLIKPGTIGKIQGIDEIRRMNGIEDVVLSYEEGEGIHDNEVGLLKQIGCRVLGVSGTYEEMKKTVQTVAHTIRILDLEDRNLILPALESIEYEKDIFIRS